LNHLEPVQFAHRHRDPFCRSHRNLRRRDRLPASVRYSKADI
jgi:hypothetical protein